MVNDQLEIEADVPDLLGFVHNQQAIVADKGLEFFQ